MASRLSINPVAKNNYRMESTGDIPEDRYEAIDVALVIVNVGCDADGATANTDEYVALSKLARKIVRQSGSRREPQVMSGPLVSRYGAESEFPGPLGNGLRHGVERFGDILDAPV